MAPSGLDVYDGSIDWLNIDDDNAIAAFLDSFVLHKVSQMKENRGGMCYLKSENLTYLPSTYTIFSSFCDDIFRLP